MDLVAIAQIVFAVTAGIGFASTNIADATLAEERIESNEDKLCIPAAGGGELISRLDHEASKHEHDAPEWQRRAAV